MRLAPLALAAPLLAPAAAAQCPEWSSGFENPGAADGPVTAQLVDASGATPLLYVGGDFRSVGDTVAEHVAVWDGSGWSALGQGTRREIFALALFDSGGGPELWAGGPDYLGRFDGSSWSEVDIGGGSVRALAVFDAGGGPSLYAGGPFLPEVDAVQVDGLARFDGSAWTNPGDLGAVHSLATYDPGGGERLFVGGSFGAFEWDGVAYASLAGGQVAGTVFAMDVYDGGLSGGPDLYLGGDFSSAGGASTVNWARYDGAAFHALPPGMGVVRTMETADVGGGETLFLGTDTVMRFDGTTSTEQPLGGARLEPWSMASFGSPEQLLIGSRDLFTPVSPGNLARWNGVELRGFEETLGLAGEVTDLGLHDFGFGQELVAGGTLVVGNRVRRVARFDGQRWRSVGSNLQADSIEGFARHDDGSGATLYVTGVNLRVDGVRAPAARLRAGAWERVGGSISGSALALASFDGSLYLAGFFDAIEGSQRRNVARWDGSAWQPLAEGLFGNGAFCLEVFDDGTGEALYVGGDFFQAGALNAFRIARWDGGAWSALPGIGPTRVTILTAWHSPDGPRLIAGGNFSLAGGDPARNVAGWDGSSWSPLGTGIAPTPEAFAAFDPDGLGERLFAVGSFQSAGPVPARVAAWDGTAWSGFASNQDTTLFSPHALQGFDAGDGRALFLGAGLSGAILDNVPGSAVSRLVNPCGEVLGNPYCGSEANSTGARALLRGSGSSSLAAQDLTLVVHQMPPGRPVLRFFGGTALDVPFGEGRRCAGGSVFRIQPPTFSDVNGDSTASLDFSAPYAAQLVPATTVYFQATYRDPAGGPSGFNTTDGLAVALRP